VVDRFPLARIPDTVRGIAGRLHGAGHDVWFVGGAVRDVLLELETGRAPRRTGDFDIATSARPEQVQALFRRTVPVGIEHGTIAVLDEEGRTHEVTTFRRDVKTDGRHAEVEFGVSLEDDLARRDFTINAVAVHPESGDLRDPFGGRADLAARVVRAVGDAAARMREDRLRVLRALRFATALEFTIDPGTWEAVRGSAQELSGLSRERVRDEWLKTLATGQPSVAVGLWRRASVLGEVWPELAAVPADADAGFDLVAGGDPVLVTAAMLHGAAQSPAAAAAAVQRLRFSNKDIERVRKAVAALGAPLPDATDGRAVRRWLAAHAAEADDVLGIVTPAVREPLAAALRAVRASGAPLALADLAVTGADLMAAGVPAGPGLGATLRRLLEAALDDPACNTREALLALAREPR
jgi:tRNA nucleotidyltransferase (CCA-adding enzyme)